MLKFANLYSGLTTLGAQDKIFSAFQGDTEQINERGAHPCGRRQRQWYFLACYGWEWQERLG